ncbi:MAG TPA: ubiquinol-cytochrome c reductase iron-sulfur subunit [Acidobacteria bacterium]|nr:ubiquinol-cytochrome c reductase iron-sulfur subunit [Acidobacteriota bacterium]
MKLLDDLSLPESPQSTTRRRFLSTTTLGALGVTLAGTLAICGRFLWPSVLFEAPSRFLAARIGDVLRRPILFLRKRRVYVVRDERGVFSESAVCTHLGCLTRPNPGNDGFFCPCHGSRFALDGTVIKGPAPDPLAHFKTEQRDEHLWVDVSVEEDRDVRIKV